MNHLKDSFFYNTILKSMDICQHHTVPLNIPEEFRHSTFSLKNDVLHVSCGSYYIFEYGEHRMVSILSGKIDILIWFFFPDPEWQLPVYAMQFVRLSAKPMIGVLDLPTLYGQDTKIANMMSSHILTDVNVPYNSDIPAWYATCRSGYDLFTRPDHDDCFIALEKAHLRTLEVINGLTTTTREMSCSEMDTHAQAIQHYKHHHHINSPGLPLLNNICGKAWTDRFMSEWLFA